MGVLTEDMTRLRNEILALRSSRQGLIHDLERETKDRQADVSRRLAHFSKSFGAGARRTKADRLGSISDLKRTVSDVLTGVRADLSGIRQAWLVLGTDSRGAEDPEGRRSQTGGKGRVGHFAGEKPARRKPKR